MSNFCNFRILVDDDDIKFKPMSGCKYCGLDHPCVWRLKRQELMEYYNDCHKRQKGFGELGCVDSINKGARKVMYVKLNQLLGKPHDLPTPTCCVNGLSYLFPSTAFQDGTQLTDFLSDGERACKRKRQGQLANKILFPNEE